MTGEGSHFRRVMNGAALAVLVGTGLWLAFHWSALPDTLTLQMKMGAAPTLGPKERLLIGPLIMLLLYLLLSSAEKVGALNMPDLGSPGRSQAAAREASAGLKFFCMSLLALAPLTMLATSDAAPPGVVGSFFAFVGGAGLTVWLLSALRRRWWGEARGPTR